MSDSVRPHRWQPTRQLSLGFSRQEHWSGLPFPSPMHESEKWKWSCSVVPDFSGPHGLQPTRLLRPWDFPGKSTGVGYQCLLHTLLLHYNCVFQFSSVAQLCPTLCDPMNGSTLAHPVLHQFLSLPKLMFTESVMLSNHLILCHPFVLLPSIFPSIRVFSNESALRIRWPKYWSFSFICQIYTHWRQSIIVNILQGIFPTPGWIPGLLHCRQNLYPLSHQGSLLVNMGEIQEDLLDPAFRTCIF